MRLRVALLVGVGLSLIAATCVTSVHERSPEGPWAGHVVNTGQTSIVDSFVRGIARDGHGALRWLEAPTCPSKLEPGQIATWGVTLRHSGWQPAPPLDLEFVTGGVDSAPFTVEPLTASVTATDPLTNAIAVSVRNTTSHTLGGVEVCANMRAATGELLEVAHGNVTPSQLKPNETTTVVINFDALAPGAAFEVIAQGLPDCCGLFVLNAADFRETARIVSGGGSSERPEISNVMLVVGEFRNRTGRDLIDARLLAQIRGDAFYRDEALTFGCQGVIPRGGVAPVWLWLPIRPGTDLTRVDYTITGVEATPSTGAALRQLPVENLDVQEFDVRGDVVNNTGEWMYVRAACFLAHDGQRLVGATSIPYNTYLAHGERLRAWGNVGEIDGVATKRTIVAYGEPVAGPPPPVIVP